MQAQLRIARHVSDLRIGGYVHAMRERRLLPENRAEAAGMVVRQAMWLLCWPADTRITHSEKEQWRKDERKKSAYS
jgi:hypothetical protein